MKWLLSCLLVVSASVQATIDPDALLPVEVAFPVAVVDVNAQAIAIEFDIQPEHYLYRKRLAFSFAEDDGTVLGAAQMRRGQIIEDEFFGRSETFRGRLRIRLPIDTLGAPGPKTLQVQYQGCADIGICYPPSRTELAVEVPAASVARRSDLNALLSGSGLAGLSSDDSLPPDQAFIAELIALDASTLMARLTAADGYYLYRDMTLAEVMSPAGVKVAGIERPAGEAKVDAHFGDVQVWYDQVEISIALTGDGRVPDQVEVELSWQGCREQGICYPPQNRLFAVALPAGEFAVESGAVTTAEPETVEPFVAEHDRLAASLQNQQWLALLTFFGLGLLLAFTPCVFPMVPILSGIIAGQKDLTTRRAATLSLIYVLAMAVTYAGAGTLAGMFGANLQAAFQTPWVIIVFVLIFIALALSMFGFYELQLPSSVQTRLDRLSNQQQGGSWIGVAIMGVLSALIVGPCVAPPLAGALIYISESGDALFGGLALFVMALGMGLPLLLIGVSAGKILPSAGGWMETVKHVFGVMLLALGIWMLERIVPGSVALALWGALLIASGVYLGALRTVAAGWPRLWRALGILALITGSAQWLGALSGGDDPLRPLAHLTGNAGASASSARPFTYVDSLEDVQQVVAASQQPVMLDFYADWCVDCKRMDRYTFPESVVVDALSDVTLIKVDVTANDDVDQALLSHFKLYGPPATLFFVDGEERANYRLLGYVAAQPFAEHVARAVAP